MENFKIVIAIPTFRRILLLKKLLISLFSELNPRDIFIVVGDNDCGNEVPALISTLIDMFPSVMCIPVDARGISQVRNALVEFVSGNFYNWQYLIMLDDDGYVMPGWFESLQNTFNEFPAEVYGGPVLGDIPDRSNFLARNSLYATRASRYLGYVDSLSGAQNIVIAKSTLNYIDYPLFDPAYGLSGGEDYAFFRRLKAKGARFVWAADACVTEPTPIERLHPKRVLSRYYTTGKYMATIDLNYDGLYPTLYNAIKGLIGSLAKFLKNALFVNVNGLAASMLLLAHFLGRLMGLAGSRSSRYL